MRNQLPSYFLIAAIVTLVSCEKPFEKTSETLFTELSSDKSGITFSNDIKEDRKLNYMFYQSIYNGAGVGVADLDNDGLQDIFFAGNQVADKLYQNLGDLQFEDVTIASGIEEDKGWSTGVAIQDVNGDGLKDIYVSKFLLEDVALRKNKLYINKGGMKFEEQAEEVGLADTGYSIQAAFLDYDNDGDIDLYVVNQPPNHSSRRIAMKGIIDYTFTDKLYRNDGASFTDVTAEAGITNFAFGLSAITSDIDQDGWTDIYVSCDFDEPDMLYMNNGDGTFREVAEESLQHMSNFSMGADIADFNNDGMLDIFTADMVAEDNKRLKTNMSGMNPKKFWALVDSGYHHQYMFNALQVNQGNGRFSEIGQLAGVSATDWSWSALFSDLDLDGYKDLLITNGLKRDVRNNDFNIERRRRVKELEKEANESGKSGISLDPLELLALSPSTLIPNYLYRNQGDMTFQNTAAEWGLGEPMMSHGAAYADLDNDGDMDLVTNNMDRVASIFENKRESYVDHHWIQIELDAPQLQNSRVSIFSEAGQQTQEVIPIRGYMSTSTEVLQFGLGTQKKVDRIEIVWPDGQIQEIVNPKIDRRLKIKKDASGKGGKKSAAVTSLFREASGLSFTHKENDFDDFKTEILLPHRMSTLGPCMCKGDVNGDGNEDLYIGAAFGSSGELFVQRDNATFGIAPLPDSRRFEDTGCALFDADSDGDLDLYVVSGGNEQRTDLYAYQDRLYLNDGRGNFSDASTRIPLITASGSCVRPADIDGDGDMDLFVGGRQVPGKYPYPADSKILINEGSHFSDQSEALMPRSKELGMVTDALWHDRDGDGDQDLTVVGEWMPIMMFANNDGKLELENVLENSSGWWNSIAAVDANGDGDEDLIAGNLGLNIKYKASADEPFQIFSDDFDDNGSNDIYMAYYQDGNCFPVRGRQCSSQQLPFVKEKFPSYAQFGEASVYDVLGPDTAGALNLKVQQFSSVFLINDGGSYSMKALPTEAQLSVLNSVIYEDLDHDGIKDLHLSGNQFDREVETTRSDASYGLFMKGKTEGGFDVMPLSYLGIYVGDNVRSSLYLRGKQKNLIVFGINDDQARCFAENQISE